MVDGCNYMNHKKNNDNDDCYDDVDDDGYVDIEHGISYLPTAILLAVLGLDAVLVSSLCFSSSSSEGNHRSEYG